MRDDIERGVTPPGTPMRLSAIATRLGVSTMPVRAALRRLERDGLVRQHARRGATVAPLELDDIEEIQAIRWGVEGLAARLGAAAADAGTDAALQRHLDRLRRATAARDTDAYLAAWYDLLDSCYAAAGRPRLLATVRLHRRAAMRYVRFVFGAMPLMDPEPAERFTVAVGARDGAAAEHLVQAQIERLLVLIADRMEADRMAAG
jgi:DNA-binding GntR family transcriptional regulator